MRVEKICGRIQLNKDLIPVNFEDVDDNMGKSFKLIIVKIKMII